MNQSTYTNDQSPSGKGNLRKLPIHQEIEDLSQRVSSDEAWLAFTEKTLKMNGWMVSAVQEIVRQRRWASAPNPVGNIKTASIREANKMGLRADQTKAAVSRSCRCSCGFTTQADALKTGHECRTSEVDRSADLEIPFHGCTGPASNRSPTLSGDAVLRSPEGFRALFESLCSTPGYDQNALAWDRVLQVLNLKLCYQPAIALILGQRGWRSAPNPRAYVATAAVRQALSMRLLDYTEKDFKVLRSSELAGDREHSMDLSVDGNGNDRPTSDQERADNAAYKFEMQSSSDNEDARYVPEWLQRGSECDGVDWQIVAKYAALKQQMVASLAFTLELRFEDRLTRDAAVHRGERSRRNLNVEASWKWIDRNWKDRIAPLFQMDCAPNPAWIRPRRLPVRRDFIPPGEIIKIICNRRQKEQPDLVHSPSIRANGSLEGYRIIERIESHLIVQKVNSDMR